MWRGDMICVGAHPSADDFGVDLSASGFGVFKLFKNDSSATFSKYKSVAGLIIRATGPGRIVVTGAHSLAGIKTAHATFVDRSFTSTAYNRYCLTHPDVVERIDDRIGR